MPGFDIDPVALESAIKKLEGARSTAEALARGADRLAPQELTAGDQATAQAKKKFDGLGSGANGSATASAKQIEQKLDEKINAYRATLEEYRRSEDAATVDADRVNRQA